MVDQAEESKEPNLRLKTVHDQLVWSSRSNHLYVYFDDSVVCQADWRHNKEPDTGIFNPSGEFGAIALHNKVCRSKDNEQLRPISQVLNYIKPEERGPLIKTLLSKTRERESTPENQAIENYLRTALANMQQDLPSPQAKGGAHIEATPNTNAAGKLKSGHQQE
jgi:hypothetical protein